MAVEVEACTCEFDGLPVIDPENHPLHIEETCLCGDFVLYIPNHNCPHHEEKP